MSSCVVCQEQNAQFLCSHKCHTAYCSPVCAKADWNQHYAMCGDYLDTLPKEALVVVLANMSFEDVFKKSRISKKFAFVINTPTFRKEFALKHKGVWNSRVDYWFRHGKYAYLKAWVPMLLETGAWIPDKNNFIPVAFASYNGYADILELLLANGLDPSLNSNMALNLAVEQSHANIVERLLADQRVDPSLDENYAIRKARNSEVVKALLKDHRVDPSVFNNIALQKAVYKNDSKIVQLLIDDKRVDPSVDDNYAIKTASNNANPAMVKMLLEHPRVDPSGILDYFFYQRANVRGETYTEVIRLLEDYFRRKQEREAGQEGELKRLKLGRVLF